MFLGEEVQVWEGRVSFQKFLDVFNVLRPGLKLIEPCNFTNTFRTSKTFTLLATLDPCPLPHFSPIFLKQITIGNPEKKKKYNYNYTCRTATLTNEQFQDAPKVSGGAPSTFIHLLLLALLLGWSCFVASSSISLVCGAAWTVLLSCEQHTSHVTFSRTCMRTF